MLWLITRPLGFIFRPISLLMRGDFRGLFALLLGFALLGGLWETALFSLTSPATATAVMTEAGVAVINPALGTMGVGPSLLANIQADGMRRPSDPVVIPGLKSQAVGLTAGDLTGLTFDQATRKIYGNVAHAYYTGGPDAVFTVSVPTISLLPAGHLDWLTALGLSTATLTARGHTQTQQLALYLWGAAGVLGLIVLLLSKGWSRFYALSQAIFTAAVPGLVLIGVVAVLAQRAPGVFGPFSTLLHVIGGAVVPVYAGAAVTAIAALIVGMIGSAATKTAAVARKAAQRTPVPVGAGRGTSSAQAASSLSYRPYNPSPAAAPNPGMNIGGSPVVAPSPDPRSAGGAAPSHQPSYGAGYRPSYDQGYEQGQAWGYAQGYGQSEPPNPGIAAQGGPLRRPSNGRSQYPASYGQVGAEPEWPAPTPGEERMLQPTGTDGPAADAWLTDQGPQQNLPQSERRQYPDYRSY